MENLWYLQALDIRSTGERGGGGRARQRFYGMLNFSFYFSFRINSWRSAGPSTLLHNQFLLGIMMKVIHTVNFIEKLNLVLQTASPSTSLFYANAS